MKKVVLLLFLCVLIFSCKKKPLANPRIFTVYLKSSSFSYVYSIKVNWDLGVDTVSKYSINSVTDRGGFSSQRENVAVGQKIRITAYAYKPKKGSMTPDSIVPITVIISQPNLEKQVSETVWETNKSGNFEVTLN